jgi:mono/diheme cytochrome c family protein
MLRPEELWRFREWLEEVAGNGVMAPFVRSLTDAEVREVANYLADNGVHFNSGEPVSRNLDRLYEALEEAFIEVAHNRAKWRR